MATQTAEIDEGQDQKSMEQKAKPIGIIIPPADIRKFADKTAEFVAKNGTSFEELVIKTEKDNPKFSFLKLSDPYRAYYDNKVMEFKQSTSTDLQLINQQSAPQNQEKQQQQQQPSALNQAFASQLNFKKELKRDVKPPPPDQFYVKPSANLTPLDCDIIKHTAQFVAKNGQKFLRALTEREKQNVQFDFLKPNHQWFIYFTSLVDAYSKCIAPRKDEVVKLQNNIEDKMSVLNRVSDRYEYESQEKQAQKRKEELDEEERYQMNQIDWQDFIVVENIDLFDNEDLPQPQQFGKEKQQQFKQPAEQPNPSYGPQIASLTKEIPPEKTQSKDFPEYSQTLEIQKDLYLKPDDKRASVQQDNQPTVKCPVCQHLIPANEFNEHVRIELLDPKYREVKQDIAKRQQSTNTASNDEIKQYLSQFAKKRPDIFGTYDEEIQDHPNKKQKVEQNPKIWDGQAMNMNRTTANYAMLQQQQKKNMEETMKGKDAKLDINQQLLSNQMTIQPQPNPNPNPIQKLLGNNLQQQTTSSVSKSKINESQQNEAGNRDKITINIKLPQKPDLNQNLKGQILNYKLEPTQKITFLKDMISTSLGGFSSTLWRLQLNCHNIEDSKTIAQCNLKNNSIIELIPE